MDIIYIPFQQDEGILPIPNISTAGRSRKQFIYLASYMRRGLEGSTSSGATTTGVGVVVRDSVLYMAEADGN